MVKYRVLTGLSFGSESVNAGEIVDNIPAKSIRWLREQGLIQLVDAKGVAVDEPEPVEETKPIAPTEDDK